MDPADVQDIVAQLHRGRERPLGSCQCPSCQSTRTGNSPVLKALADALRMAAAQQSSFTIASEYVPLVLAALQREAP